LGKLLVPDTLGGVLAIFNAYLLLVGTIIAFGVLAFYLNHKRTQEICFWMVCALLLAIPIIALTWYFRQTSWERSRGEVVDEKRRLLERFGKSSFVRFLSRHSRAIMLLSQALYIAQIANAIRLFPKHPRLSLAIIVYCMASSFGSVLVALTTRMTARNSELKLFMLETTSVLN